MTVLRIYTDGGCAGNQSKTNFGGWGAVLEYGQHQKELHGGAKNTTNNLMEMTALLEAFKAVKIGDLAVKINMAFYAIKRNLVNIKIRYELLPYLFMFDRFFFRCFPAVFLPVYIPFLSEAVHKI